MTALKTPNPPTVPCCFRPSVYIYSSSSNTNRTNPILQLHHKQSSQREPLLLQKICSK
jgi:hypothetical protein